VAAVGIIDASGTAEDLVATARYGITAVGGAVITVRTVDGSETLTGAIETLVLARAHRPIITWVLVVGMRAGAVRLASILGARITVVAELFVRLSVTVVVDAIAHLDGSGLHRRVEGRAVIGVGRRVVVVIGVADIPLQVSIRVELIGVGVHHAVVARVRDSVVVVILVDAVR